MGQGPIGAPAAPSRYPYAWGVEYPTQGGRVTRVLVIVHDEDHDLAYAERRAVDLRGVLVNLIADRRTS
jgi:hypothetical protein